MPLPNEPLPKDQPVNEEGNTYYTITSIGGTKVPAGFYEDIVSAGNRKYGIENLDATYRQIAWTQISPGVWQVSVGPPL